jgi:hypothetical protein
MKRLHRDDLFGWSMFVERLDIDFNSFVWVRPGGNVVVDPLALSAHDLAHLRALGGAAWVVVTNSDHVREAEAVARAFGAQVAGPAAERADFPMACDRWLVDGDWVVEGLQALELHGSKTPGELALVLEGDTLITGDLVRAHRADTLHLLPPEKLTDRGAAARSVERLLGLGPFRAVLPGDGWCAFRDGHALLGALAARLKAG